MSWTKPKETGDLQKNKNMVSSMSSSLLQFKGFALRYILYTLHKDTVTEVWLRKKKVAGPALPWLHSGSERDWGQASGTSEPGENSSAAIAAPELTLAYKLCQLPAAKHQVQGTDYKEATLPSLTRFWLQCISLGQLPYSSDT